MTMIHPDTIVIRDDDTLADLVEAWGHIARTVSGEGRTRRSDALLDEVAQRRDQVGGHGNSQAQPTHS